MTLLPSFLRPLHHGVSICTSLFLVSLFLLPVQSSHGQNSLSRSSSTSADTLLDSRVNENDTLQDEYYREMNNNEQLYSAIPEDIRQIFSRIRFLSMSLEDVEATDQVLNSLTRAYLLYDLEEAAFLEAEKISSVHWQVRTLVDFADFYNMLGQPNNAKEMLDQAYALLNQNSAASLDKPEVTTQYYQDIASRLALLNYPAESINALRSIPNNNFIQQLEGLLLVVDRMRARVPTNLFIGGDNADLSERTKQCHLQDKFIVPKNEFDFLSATMDDSNKMGMLFTESIFIQQGYVLFEEHQEKDTIPNTLQSLETLFKLSNALYSVDARTEAMTVLRAARQKFLPEDFAIPESELRRYAIPLDSLFNTQDLLGSIFDPSNWDNEEEPFNGFTELDAQIEYVRSLFINAFIQVGDVRSAMKLTEDLVSPAQSSLAYISVGKAHNANGNQDIATSLFNYAEDLAKVIPDPRVRDFVMIGVVEGQSNARLYDSALRNAALIRREDLRYISMYVMAKAMIENGDLNKAYFMLDYIAPTDLRIELLANLGYLRSAFSEQAILNADKLVPATVLFDQIITIMNDPYVNGQFVSLDRENTAILHAMCAHAERLDLQDLTIDGRLVVSKRQSESNERLREAAVNYTSLIDNIYRRAASFNIIAASLLEQNDIDDAQPFLDAAWNLAWSARGKANNLINPIFLRIVRGKILSGKMIDAYNVANGMRETESTQQEVSRNPLTGNMDFSPRIEALIDFSRYAMSTGEYGIALRAIDNISIGEAKSLAMTKAIGDLITTDRSYNFDNVLAENS